MRMKAIVLAMTMATGAAWAQSPGQDPPDAAAHVAKAEALAGDQFASSLSLCHPEANDLDQLVKRFTQDRKAWLPPTRAFDNLYYIGSKFVGVWILRTSDGLILFDSGESPEEVEHRILPDMRTLGLDPADIRYVLVTHAHWDHYGGAPYFQEHYPNARIGLTGPDWEMLETSTPGSLERAPPFEGDKADRVPPKRDLVIEDGQHLTLGDTTLTLFVAPGHTPGTLAALIPVHEGGHTYTLSLLGGTAFPSTLEPSNRMGGLIQFQNSVERLSKASRQAGAVGLINTHVSVDGSVDRLAAVRARGPDDPNPFVLGSDAVTRYYGMFSECLQAAEARIRAKK